MPTTTIAEQSTVAREPRSSFQVDVESSYILDCEVEYGGITPLEAQVLRSDTPAGRAYMRRNVDVDFPPHWLRNTARQYLDGLPRESRYVWALYGLTGIQFAVQAFQERIECAVQHQVQRDLGVRKQVSLMLNAEDQSDGVLFATVHDVTPATVQAFVESHYAEGKARLEDDLRLLQEAIQWYHDGNQERAREIAHKLGLNRETRFSMSATSRIPNSAVFQKQNRRRARGAIKKVLKLFVRTGAEENVRLLVSGQEVTLSHPDSPFRFVLKAHASGWLEKETVRPGGHVPYQLSVMTKDGEFLSRLCVLFQETPVLDQLLALTMFVKAGDELEILEGANWFGIGDEKRVLEYVSANAPTLLEKKLKYLLPREDEKPGSPLDLRSILRAHAFSAEQLQWEPYRGPVKQWVSSWFGDLVDRVNALGQHQTAMPALAA